MEDPVELRFTAHPSTGDVVWNAATLMRRSAIMIAFGTFATATSAVAIVEGDPTGIVFLALGLSFLTGLFVAPFVWWAVHRRRDLVLAPLDVEADTHGLSIASSYGSTQHAWSVFRSARETSRAFVLDTGIGSAALITKRGVDPGTVSAFRGHLVRAGLLRLPVTAMDRIRPLLWVGVGLAVAGALIAGPRLIGGIDATAKMELDSTVDGRTITVRGTTDLPDGAIVDVQLTQIDEWEHETADGVAPDVETSPWVLYEEATVRDGRFNTTFQPDGWPAGRGGVAAYFSVDTFQPSMVVDRFGSSGENLRGPDVSDQDGYGPTLEVYRVIALP